jgi:hypothetical protein
MTLSTVIIFAGGMLVGASTIALILGLCISSGKSSLEGEIMELREITNRQQCMIEALNNQLEQYKKECC